MKKNIFDSFFNTLLNRKKTAKKVISDSFFNHIENMLLLRRDGQLFAYTPNYIRDADFENNLVKILNNDQMLLRISNSSTMDYSKIDFKDKQIFAFYFQKKPYTLVFINMPSDQEPEFDFIKNSMNSIEESLP